MRGGLSTIQQTLTPEAASVLNQSIAEAGRRSHGHTTPLHVATTLLASPSGFLRQACIKSHPNSSHPLQCRALELCFSVALDRLPTAQTGGQASSHSVSVEPPLSNALMAALKRAQAHQRRGCPEQQQQPLLAVKVELEQLVLSILDDPSVSRVMREASFSSPAVKATIEQSLNSSVNKGVGSSSVGLGFRPSGVVPGVFPMSVNRNLYLNPRLQQQQQVPSDGCLQQGQGREEDVRKVIEVLMRSKKRNLVLVGESEPEVVIKEVLRRIESKELGEGVLKNVEVINVEKELVSERLNMPRKINELGASIETRIVSSSGGSGFILYLGDLKWLVEQPGSLGGVNSGGVSQRVVSEIGRAAVAEMAKLLARFGKDGSTGCRLWLIGIATCETYLRCQVYHSSIENDWDIQAVPIAARAPVPGVFPRQGSNRILTAPVESLSPLKGFPGAPAVLSGRVPENLNPYKIFSCCPECMQAYEKELANLKARDFEKSDVKTESARPQLPQWLQSAKVQHDDAIIMNHTQTKDQEMNLKQKTLELQKKWKDTCFRSHPNFHRHTISLERITPTPLSVTSLYNPKLLQNERIQPKLQANKNLRETMQLKPNLVTSQPTLQAPSPPGSPVRTELALGRPKVAENTPENTRKGETRDFLGIMPAEPHKRSEELQNEKLVVMLDADFFKRLIKGLLEKVWWQREAASLVATTVIQCKVGSGKRRSKGDIWLFLTGPDRTGKKKMASALAELVNGTNPITISLGSRRGDGEPDMNFRGKTALDRIVEAVRRNPFSVVMLEDIDEADLLVRGSIKQAMERGRLADSYGREISLGNVIFLVTANWVPDSVKNISDAETLDDEKLASLASSGLQLRLSLWEKTAKRHANWLLDEQRYTKSRKESSPALSFDLNEAADVEDGRANSSRNSSDLTIDNEIVHGLQDKKFPLTLSACGEILKCVDDTIAFKSLELGAMQSDVANLITKRFSGIMGDEISIEIQDNALEKILAGLWVSGTSLEEWTEKALVPSFRKLKSHLLATDTGASPRESSVFRLEIDEESDRHGNGDWLPSNIKVVTNGLGN